MEGLTRLVSESMARHGFDRPLDYRRLHWSRWFRCESPHSLLVRPQQARSLRRSRRNHGLRRRHAPCGDGRIRPSRERSERPQFGEGGRKCRGPSSRAARKPDKPEAASRRMLAVTQFFEDDDMAFVLDRMLSRQNPMRARLTSGRYFVRFVVIEDRAQRRTICNALNQWMVTAAEKATGIGSHFATSLELTPATEYVAGHRCPAVALCRRHRYSCGDGRFVRPAKRSERNSGTEPAFSGPTSSPTAPQLDSGAATNIHCPSPFPSGFLAGRLAVVPSAQSSAECSASAAVGKHPETDSASKAAKDARSLDIAEYQFGTPDSPPLAGRPESAQHA